MKFLYPEYFLWLLVILFIFLKRDFRKFTIAAYGYMLSVFFIVIALSRPVVEHKPIETKEVLSDVIIALDLSYSMQSNDIEPTRLGYAKEMLKKLVEADNKSRFGILGFTTNAIVLSPLTNDKELLLHLFSSLDEKNIITKGSSIYPALELARKMSNSKKLSVVILSDGGDEFGYDAEAHFAKENSLTVNIFMTATTMGGTLRQSNGELLKDELGDIVVSRENEAIKVVSDVSGGVYSKDFDEIVAALKSQAQKDKEAISTVMQNDEYFYYFIFLAIAIFLITATTLRKHILALLLLFGINLSANENIEYFNKATILYKEGNYEEALKNYEMVKSDKAKVKAVVFYNIGNTLVRLKEFERAKEAYIKSLTLGYSKEADQNLDYIRDAQESKEMSSGKQQSKDKSSLAKQERSDRKPKDGGSSNMNVSAASSSGGDDKGKESKSEGQVSLEGGKAKLSSKQYELINIRGVNEKKPW